MDKRITGQEFNAGPFGFLAFVVLLKFRMGFRLGTFLWLQYCFIFYTQLRVFYSTLVSSIPEPLLFLRVLISFLISLVLRLYKKCSRNILLGFLTAFYHLR